MDAIAKRTTHIQKLAQPDYAYMLTLNTHDMHRKDINQYIVQKLIIIRKVKLI